jgi:predicted nucleic acid-binding protein
MERKRLVLDANILIRGCFGRRVRTVLANHAEQADFFVAQAALSEASRYVADLARRRGLDEAICLEALQSLLIIVQVVDDALIAHTKDEAQARIRDPEDWPTLALSLQLECAVWTEDQDFFGTGVATWTSSTVERYLDA